MFFLGTAVAFPKKRGASLLTAVHFTSSLVQSCNRTRRDVFIDLLNHSGSRIGIFAPLNPLICSHRSEDVTAANIISLGGAYSLDSKKDPAEKVKQLIGTRKCFYPGLNETFMTQSSSW